MSSWLLVRFRLFLPRLTLRLGSFVLLASPPFSASLGAPRDPIFMYNCFIVSSFVIGNPSLDLSTSL